MADEITCTFEEAAEIARRAHAATSIDVGKHLDGVQIGQQDAIFGIAEGSLAQAVDAYLRYMAVFGVPLNEARALLDKSVDHYWKQGVVAHVTERARRASGGGA